MPNREPDFSMEGVEEEYSFYLKDGESLIGELMYAASIGKFKGAEFETYDEHGNDYIFECWAFKIEDRYGIARLYLFLHDTEDENEKRGSLYYMAQNTDGKYLVMLERDEFMFAKMNDFFTGKRESTGERESKEYVSSEEPEPKKKKGKGWAIAFKIILFPFWLIWQFIKALLSLFNIAFGDSSAVQAFKRGYNGESASSSMDEYTFINDMGCEQTVYSSNGRDFYDSNGAYVGSSNDNGKTIHK